MRGWSHRGWRQGLAVLALGLLSACASAPRPSAKPEAALDMPAGQFRFEYGPRDEEAAGMVRLAVERALPRLVRWGSFDEPVTLVIHPNHAALERAANRSGYDFLRAWARYEQIELQSPRTWTLFGASQAQVDELLLHELTHSLMYQVASDRMGWTRKSIPLWFREGMASYTAGQGYRVPSLEDLSRFLHERPNVDPFINKADALYQKENDVVYGAAHHAFTFLAHRYGEDTLREVLHRMSQGPDFPQAFTEVVGITPEVFLQDFRRYVFWRGFKGGRIPPRPEASPPGPSPAPTPMPAPMPEARLPVTD